MLAIILDMFNHILFEFNEYKEKDESLLLQFKSLIALNPDSDEVTKHGFYIRDNQETLTIHMLFPKVSNKKDAKFRAKIFIDAIASYNNYFKVQEDIYSTVFYSSYHNTKNIAHSVKGRIENLVNYSNIMFGSDKIAYINDVIQSNTLKTAREILALYKSVEQMQFEYDIIDYLKPGTKLNDKDFSYVKIHPTIVQAYYIYETEFREKQITVQISECHKYAYCNFFSMRSAFVLVFENCLKYSLSDTVINVNFIEVCNYFRINISMTSVYNENEDIKNMFLPGKRGFYAEKLAYGSGYGLYVVKHLLALNNIIIHFQRISESNFQNNDIKYSDNLFSIDIPIEIVTNEK